MDAATHARLAKLAKEDLASGPRRSLRKREEKSYAESPDLIIEEDDNSNSNGRPFMKHGLGGADRLSSLALNNGDVEMMSDGEDNPKTAGGSKKIDDDDDDDSSVTLDETTAPVQDIPLPKVKASLGLCYIRECEPC
jgi:hypothetical protein